MENLEIIHSYPLNEQMKCEMAKISVNYPNTESYKNNDWFNALASEFGEVANAMNELGKKKYMKTEFSIKNIQENLEYELLQTMTLCSLWLTRLRK